MCNISKSRITARTEVDFQIYCRSIIGGSGGLGMFDVND